jgi:hypothetical protein
MKMKMNLLILFILFNFTILTIETAQIYEDDYDVAMRRLNFANNHTEKITGGKVIFEYEESKGVYCKANKDLYSSEFTFEITREFIICSFDIFPYMFELKEPLVNYYKNAKQIQGNQTLSYFMYLFSLNLMYINFQNKTFIENHLKNIKKDYYIPNISQELKDYMNSLPKASYGVIMFNEEEIELQKILKLNLIQYDETKELHEFIIKYVQENLKSEAEYILPWIQDLYLFKYYSSIIASRSFKVNLFNYEKFINKSISDLPMGKARRDFISELTPDRYGTCLIPFIDLCNHKNPQDFNLNDKVDFLILSNNNKLSISLNKKFQKNEDYEYSYINYPSNAKLFVAYGFTLENNIVSIAEAKLPIDFDNFPKYKHDLCLKKQYIEYPFDQYYQSNMKHINIWALFNKLHINDKVLNLIRIMLYPNKRFNEKTIIRRLSKNRMLNYPNEMTSLAYYRQTLKAGLKSSKLNLVLYFLIIF